MDELYLYGITSARGLSLHQIHGLAGGVSVLEQGGIGAIVGTPTGDAFHELSRERALRLLLGHQEVLEAAMVNAAVLPVKFGTVAPHEGAVRSLLHQRQDMLSELLAKFRGYSQFEIAVLWQPKSIFAGIAKEPEIAEARIAAETGVGTGPAAAVRRGQMVKAAFERRRSRLQAALHQALSPLAAGIAFNALMDDRMAANIAVLTGHAGAERLQAQLEKLDAEFGGQLTFRCVGPLPPASFATLQVGFPPAQAIDQARQTLGLAGPASQDAITSAFRRLARENHPDLAAPGEERAKRMAELTAAYRLLLSCAKSQELAAPGAGAEQPVLVEILGRKSDAPQMQQGSAE